MPMSYHREGRGREKEAPVTGRGESLLEASKLKRRSATDAAMALSLYITLKFLS